MQFAASDLDRVEVDGSAAVPATDAVLAFTADLHRALAARGAAAGNLVSSPYSVVAALAMARAGARGRTAEELDAVLHAPSPAPERLASGLNALDRLLTSRAGAVERPGLPDAEISLDVANSLWGQRGTGWEAAFLDALARDFGAGMHLVDYRGATEAARRAINAWVGERTHERIPELIASGVLDAMTRLVLVNAVYLKAPWETPFAEHGTEDAPFTRLDASTVAVPMMRASALAAGVGKGSGWTAVNLRYAGSTLAMAVVVPDRGRFAEVERALDGARLRRLLTGFRSAQVDLRMPRWTFRTGVELSDVLAALGMPTAFGNQADFTGMSATERFVVGAVVHEAFVAVDEQGTEAAAATAVVLRALSMPRVDLELTVDRPFLFVVHDVETATPLFIGRVTDPVA